MTHPKRFRTIINAGHIRLYLFALLFVIISSLYAQETSSLLQLSSDTNTMQTGQSYTIRVEVHDITDLWATNLLIQYDPKHIYIVGTKSGSPIKIGEMMQVGGNTIFNSINEENTQLNYAISMFNPANPVSGSGVIGTFEIVPLLAGNTQLHFVQADVLSVEFEYDTDGQRVGGNPIDIEFLPVLLELSIQGDPATPPPEASATPQATATTDPSLLPADVTQEIEPTLINVTAAPTPPISPTPVSQADGGNGIASSTFLIIVIVLMVIGLASFVVLFIGYRQSRK